MALGLRLRETWFLRFAGPIAELYKFTDLAAFVTVLFGFFRSVFYFAERVFGVADGLGNDV